MLTAQSEHTDLPVKEFRGSGQESGESTSKVRKRKWVLLLYDFTSSIPVAASYFPVGQSVQTVSPVVAAYFPVGQTVHSLTPVSRLLYLPTGHAEQEREAEIEYFPFSHAVQSSVFMPPARSLHSLRVSLTRQVTK